MADDLSRLPFAVGLGRASRAIIRQNLAIALGVIGLLVVTSVLGLIQLGAAVLLHEGSTIRITSYNVCYTKLLRSCPPSADDSAPKCRGWRKTGSGGGSRVRRARW